MTREDVDLFASAESAYDAEQALLHARALRHALVAVIWREILREENAAWASIGRRDPFAAAMHRARVVDLCEIAEGAARGSRDSAS